MKRVYDNAHELIAYYKGTYCMYLIAIHYWLYNKWPANKCSRLAGLSSIYGSGRSISLSLLYSALLCKLINNKPI